MHEEYNIKFDFEENKEELKRIRKDLNTLLSTRRGSLATNRDFGISWSMLSETTPDAEQDLMIELVNQIETYIPEVTVQEVNFEVDSISGKLIPTITIERNDNYDR